MEEQQDLGSVMYSEDTTLSKELTGISFDKKELLDKTISVVVKGLGKNKWGKDLLVCTVDDDDINLPISKSNKNELIDLLGTTLKDWIGKEVNCSGVEWEGIIEGETRTGVTLKFHN